MRRRSALLPLVVLALLPAAGASAATITVNTETDVADPNDGRCSLREAITAANDDDPSGAAAGECDTGAGADVVALRAGTYRIEISGQLEDINTKGDFDILTDVTIEGAGASTTILDGDAEDRLIHVLAAGTATVRGVTVTDGRTTNGDEGAADIAAPGADATGDDGTDGDPGGGLRNDGTLTVENSVVTGNRAGDGGDGGDGIGGSGSGSGAAGGSGTGGNGGSAGGGGGIYSTGPLTVVGSQVTANTTGDGGDGGDGIGGEGGNGAGNDAGGIGGDGTGGIAGDGGRGGGIAVTSGATLTLFGSTVSGNTTGAGGTGGEGEGAIGGDGAGSGSGGAGGAGFGGTAGMSGRAGGVRAEGGGTILDSTIDGNVTGPGGVGGFGQGGPGGEGGATNATGGNGGSGFGGDGHRGGEGGGLFLAGTFAIEGTTIAENAIGVGGDGGDAGGGFGGAGGGASGNGGTGGGAIGGMGGPGGGGGGAAFDDPSTLTVSTVSGNAAGEAGDGGSGEGGAGGGLGGDGANGNGGAGGSGGEGGGVAAGTLTVRQSTIASNSAGALGTGGPGIGGSAASGGTAGSATPGDNGNPGDGGGFSASGLSLAGSVVAANGPDGCGTLNTPVDNGDNVTFPDTTCPGTNADPLLQPLASNGGATQTRALGAGSAAVDKVPVGANCTAADQRGFARPFGAACDAGSFESAPPSAITLAATGITATTARLEGVAGANFRATTYRFEYGTTEAYGSSTPDASAGDAGQVEARADLTGLLPETTYHYRLVTQSSDGTAAGADMTFRTTPSGVPLPPDTLAPAFLAASLSRSVFAVNPSGRAETPVAAQRRRRRVARGTTIRYRLSEAARVVFTIQRARPGRRAGRRCRKPSRSNRSRRRCTRWVRVGRFAQQGVAGANRKAFSGRIGRKRLKRGRHRAVLVATDAAGNRSAARRLTFRIVRATRR